jgi:TonB family protein
MKRIFTAWVGVGFLFLNLAIVSNGQTNRELRITYRPSPIAYKCNMKEGSVIIKVTFHKSGKITDTKISQSSGCFKFDSSAVEAARGIKFEPKIRNGEAISIIKAVQYFYSRQVISN